jgi:hypothetical protein
MRPLAARPKIDFGLAEADRPGGAARPGGEVR